MRQKCNFIGVITWTCSHIWVYCQVHYITSWIHTHTPINHNNKNNKPFTLKIPLARCSTSVFFSWLSALLSLCVLCFTFHDTFTEAAAKIVVPYSMLIDTDRIAPQLWAPYKPLCVNWIFSWNNPPGRCQLAILHLFCILCCSADMTGNYTYICHVFTSILWKWQWLNCTFPHTLNAFRVRLCPKWHHILSRTAPSSLL